MKAVKFSYEIAGLYDIILGLGVLFLRDYAIAFFNQQIPNVPILVDALGLFLIGMGILLIDEARNNEPRANIGYASSFIRIMYVIWVLYYIIFSEIEILYILFAFTDLLTGLYIILSLKRKDWKY